MVLLMPRLQPKRSRQTTASVSVLLCKGNDILIIWSQNLCLSIGQANMNVVSSRFSTAYQALPNVNRSCKEINDNDQFYREEVDSIENLLCQIGTRSTVD